MTSSKIRRGLNGLTTSSPPHSTPFIMSPNQTIVPCQTRCSSCLSLSSGLELPATLWNYSNKSIKSSHGNQGALPSWHYKACLLQPMVVHSVPECNTCMTLNDVIWSSPEERIQLTNCCQFHPSSAVLHMFGHLHDPRVLSATRGPQQCHNLVGWIFDPFKGLPSQ